MARKKRHWLWNMLILLTLIVCVLAFVAHYKNWTKIHEDRLQILSGVYYKELKFEDIDSVLMVDKMPQMKRVNGFSAWAMEKGIFRDSINPDISVRVYVDNLRQAKIKVVHNDTIMLFLNFTDSVKTDQMYRFLSEKKNTLKAQIIEPN